MINKRKFRECIKREKNSNCLWFHYSEVTTLERCFIFPPPFMQWTCLGYTDISVYTSILSIYVGKCEKRASLGFSQTVNLSLPCAS